MVGSLMWIGRCCRPTIGYTVSTLQSASKKPNVEDMLKCNKCVRYAKETKDVGLTYKTGVHWPSRAGEEWRCALQPFPMPVMATSSSTSTTGKFVSRSGHRERVSSG